MHYQNPTSGASAYPYNTPPHPTRPLRWVWNLGVLPRFPTPPVRTLFSPPSPQLARTGKSNHAFTGNPFSPAAGLDLWPEPT
jgi:hypothetical protein